MPTLAAAKLDGTGSELSTIENALELAAGVNSVSARCNDLIAREALEVVESFKAVIQLLSETVSEPRDRTAVQGCLARLARRTKSDPIQCPQSLPSLTGKRSELLSRLSAERIFIAAEMIVEMMWVLDRIRESRDRIHRNLDEVKHRSVGIEAALRELARCGGALN